MMLLWLFLVILVFIAFGKFFTDRWSSNLDFMVSFAKEAVYAGDSTELSELVINRKKLPVPVVEAAFRIEKGVLFRDTDNIIISDYNYKRDLFALRGMEQVTRNYRLDCLKRGCYTVTQAVLTSFSVHHRGKSQKEFETHSRLYVYPERTDVSRILRMTDTILGEAESRRRFIEDPFSFASIREYTIQDPMKTINWKASARMGELMVNTFSSVQSEEYLVFLDVEDDRILREERAVERGISIAASLCSLLYRRGLKTGLYVNTDPVSAFLPKKGISFTEEIERFLTKDFEHEKTMKFMDMLSEAEVPENRICVFISKELKRDHDTLSLVRKKGIKGVCAVPGNSDDKTDYEVWLCDGGR